MNTFMVKTKAFIGNHGTDIACYGGCAAIIAGSILACRATLKINRMAEKDAAEIEELKKKYSVQFKKMKKGGKKNASGNNNGDDGVEYKLTKEGRKAVSRKYAKCIGKYILAAAPAVALIGGGCAANIYAHHKEKSGRLQMTGIAMGALASLGRYRAEMAKERGEEAEKKFYYNVKENEKEEVDEKGKKKKVKEEFADVDICKSDFAKFFGVDYSDAATGYPEADLVFLKNVERAATRRLRTEKWLSVNDLYHMLRLKDSAGQRYAVKGGNNAGWVYDKEHPENNIVDLGLYNLKKTGNHDYINGYNDVILIEPNINCLDLSNALWGLDMKTPDPMLFQD